MEAPTSSYTGTGLYIREPMFSFAPPYHPEISIFANETYYSDIMFINGLPVSSLFFYTALLCMPHCLPAHMH
jgi:hypothetical protein